MIGLGKRPAVRAMTGPLWELVPDSICTKSREAPNGPSIRIPANVTELAIGRGVQGEGYLPLWPQISTHHCRIWASPEVGLNERGHGKMSFML